MSNKLWQIDVYPASGQPDPLGRGIMADAADLGLGKNLQVTTARGYLVQGQLEQADVQRLANKLFADPVVERTVIAPVGAAALSQPPGGGSGAGLVHVLFK